MNFIAKNIISARESDQIEPGISPSIQGGHHFEFKKRNNTYRNNQYIILCENVIYISDISFLRMK